MSKKKRLVIKAHGGRFGPGKVHLPADWRNENAWSGLTLCGRHVHGEPVDITEHAVTCKLCIKADNPYV